MFLMRLRAGVVGLGVPALVCTLSMLAVADNCQLPPLNGVWIDETNGLEVEITTSLPTTQSSLTGTISLGAPTVKAVYVKPHTCQYADGTGKKPPLQTNFEGDLRLITKVNLWRIEGTLHMCKHRNGKHDGYWDARDLKLRVIDEKTLEGEFTDYQATQPTTIKLHRKPKTTVGAGHTWPCPYDEPPPADQPDPPHWFRDLMESEKERAHNPQQPLDQDPCRGYQPGGTDVSKCLRR